MSINSRDSSTEEREYEDLHSLRMRDEDINQRVIMISDLWPSCKNTSIYFRNDDELYAHRKSSSESWKWDLS